MTRRVHGVLSLLLVAAALGVGAFAVLGRHAGWGLFYLGCVPAGLGLVLYAVCAKCPCRHRGCSHVLPGFVARRLPDRREGPYHAGDILGAGAPILFLVLFPQFWVFHSPVFMVFFWLPLGAGTLEIRRRVCRGCENTNCPLRMPPRDV